MQVSSRFLRAGLTVLVLLPALLLPDAASPAEVTLQWYHSPSAAVVGYKLYFGTASRQYTDSVDVGYVTAHTFSTLPDGGVYFFAATAYDPYGNESEYSNEVVRDLKFGLAPGIYSLSVPQGVEGTLVAVTGVNLGSRKGSVYVGTRKARVMYWSGEGDSVMFLSPKKLPYETYEVGLVTADKMKSANTQLYRVMRANITGSSGGSGSPGELVRLTGQYLGPRPKVYFNYDSGGKAKRVSAKVKGYSVSDNTNSTVDFTVPRLGPGNYGVTVVNSQGTSNGWNFEVR